MAIDLYGAATDITGATGPANADSSGKHGNDTVTNGGSMAQQGTAAGNDLARGGGNVQQINTGAGQGDDDLYGDGGDDIFQFKVNNGARHINFGAK